VSPAGNTDSTVAGAKRHHYIPQFLLRNFSADQTAKNPRIFRLDKATGRISESTVGNEAVIGQFNRLEGVSAVANVEQDLAYIEGTCKPALEKAIGRADLTYEDGELIALFSVLQERRTPRSRQTTAELMEHTYRVGAELEVATGSGVRDFLKAELDREPTEDEVNAKRRELVTDLREGRIVVQATADHEVLSMFVATAEVAHDVMANTHLNCLHAMGAEFVLADHPVCRFDPTVPNDRGVGWLSSIATEVTFPISRDTCLMFQPGRAGYRHADATKDMVMDINLRSYAVAEWSVYGSGQRWLQDVRTTARRQRSKVARYESHKQHVFFFESKEGESQPHGVQVIEPKDKIVRGFRPKDRPVRRPPQTEPISDRLLREWSHLVPDDS
jgi:hypothetical protein